MKQIIFGTLCLLSITSCSLFDQKKDAKTAQETALNTIQNAMQDTLAQANSETPKTKNSTKAKETAKTKVATPAKEAVTAAPTSSKTPSATISSPSKTPVATTTSSSKISVAGVPKPKATPTTTPKAASIPIVPKGKTTATVATTTKIPVQVTAKGDVPQSYDSPLSFNAQILSAVNAMRIKGYNCGGEMMPAVKPLVWNTKLEKAAAIHAIDMDKNNHFSHVGTDGSLPDDRIKAAGYEWGQVGENIGRGYKDVAAAIKGWQESSSHCKQMMSADVTQIGAAHKGSYWCQAFAKPLE